MVPYFVHKTRIACGVTFLCWLSGTSLSTAAFAQSLPYRHNDAAAISDSMGTQDDAGQNPYQMRRRQLQIERAQLPSPDLLKAPVAALAQAPQQPAKPPPMKITIPNLKALQEARGGATPALTPLITENTNVAAVATPPAAASPVIVPTSMPPPPQIAAAPPPDPERQTVSDFRPLKPSPDQVAVAQEPARFAAAVTPEQYAALAPAAGEAAAANNMPLIALPPDESAQAAPSVQAIPPAPPVAAVPAVAEPAIVAEEEPTPSRPIVTKALDTALKDSDEGHSLAPRSEAPRALPSLTPPPAIKEKSKSAKKEKPAPLEKPYSPLDSEPEQGISNASAMIIKKIPSNIDKPRSKPAGPFSIERSKDLSKTFPTDEPTKESAEKNDGNNVSVANTHEAMGIRIAVKNNQPNLDYELEKAYNALVTGQPTMAIEIYKNILENDPRNQGGLFGIATTYHRLGQLDQARGYYGRLLAIAPNHRDGLNNFLVLLSDEAPQEALEQMEKLEERNPDFSPIPAQMAVIYQKLGNTDKAAEKMFKAIDLSPENLVYRYNLAIMLDKQKKYDEAARLYKQLIEAALRGENIPGNLQKIQQRLTFISSNRH